MDRNAFIQYSEVKEEIKDIRKRIVKLEKFLSAPHQVADTVKGSRRDGTYGNIRITGYPVPEFYSKKKMLELLKDRLKTKERELLGLMCQVEEDIESIDKSDLRIMFRLYYLDGLPWIKVAQKMNDLFPRKRVPYSEDSCRMRNNRFVAKI